VVFDLWNTLVPFPAASFDRMLEEIAAVLHMPHAHLAPQWDATWSERATGDLAIYLRGLCKQLGVQSTAEQLERVLEIRAGTHRRLFTPRADALPTLTRLRSLGIRTAVVSNTSSEVPPVWDASSLAAAVDVTVFSCTEGLMKPEPRIFELTATRLGVDPHECLYVGDGADDELDGAQAAGMDAVLLRPGDTIRPQQWSGREIASLSEVVTLLDEQR
jgi:putative hydrolase of the HAD superfamily